MTNDFALSFLETGKALIAGELRSTNALAGQYGLSLSERQIQTIAERRVEALEATGRIEFGRGIVKALVEAFCDSPFIDQENYEETILELLDSFYYFKNESEDRIPDDELIALMRQKFNTVCQGSVEYLSGTTLEDLCRNTRFGYDTDGDERLF